MTDRSVVLRDWRVVLAAGVAVLTAAVVTLVARTGDPATADSYLGEVRNAVVEAPDGSTLPAHDGQRVVPGATVRTGPGGAATVSTAGRAVYLGALTTVHLVDGVHQQLERGQLMVDGRDGPRLLLDTRAGATDVPAGALVRVETGPVLRLAVFAGHASLTAAGRQARSEVDALYQVLASYTALPGRPTVLALTDDDAWEQRLAAELVNADKDLSSLARGLSGPSGTAVLQAAPVALRSVTDAVGDRGEQALTVAVSQASRRDASLDDTLSFVLRARGDGGSWGAVAKLVDARVTAVSALLDRLLAPPDPTAPPVLAGPGSGLDGQGGVPRPSASSPPVRPGGPSATPTATRTSSPTSRPSASASPTAPADDLITTVVGLLSSSPSAKTTSLIHLP
ncbi:MAG TPA: hypothetical protein VMZ11_03290 [Mycobacteriales bacterium]|nr:hypothetical protein [Mycobacteriales bacterium]